MGYQVCVFIQELSLILWTYFTILCNPANGAGYVINTSLMPNSLENIYALLLHYYDSLPETDLQWLRQEVTKQKESKKSSRNSTHIN